MADTTTTGTVYDRIAGLEATEVPDGYVVYDVPKEMVHFLNQTAAIVYELCDGQHTADDMAAAIQSLFGLPEPPLTAAVECLSSLRDQGLVVARGPGASG